MAGRHPAAAEVAPRSGLPHDLTRHAVGVTLIDGPAGRVCASAGKSLWGARQRLEEVVPILHRDDTTEAASRLTRRGCAAGAAVLGGRGTTRAKR